MNFIKRYIMWGFFLLYPLTNAYLPNVNLGFVQLDPFRLYLLLPVLYLVHIFFINVGRLKLSRETKFLAAYTIFTLFNSWRMDHFQMSNVLNFAFPVLLIILFENLEYAPRDLKRFYKVSTLLV
ncbi:MAG: hypothetical protein GY765_33845, partial [bacterium]|nr:hypothetical protein [bacterium]